MAIKFGENVQMQSCRLKTEKTAAVEIRYRYMIFI